MIGDASNAAALKSIGGLGLAALGGGMTARALLGFRELFDKALAKRKAPQKPAVVEVGVPEVVEDEEEQEAARPMRAGLGPKFAEKRALLEHINKIPGFAGFSELFKGDQAQPSWWDWLKGRTHENWTSKPWFPAAAMTAGIGSAYGGYKALDSAMNTLDRGSRQQELEEAKEEYRKALIEQYSADSPSIKRSAARSELAKDLDELCQLYKEGEGTINDVGGFIAANYLPLAGLLAGGTGLATYNWAKSRSPEERLAKAIKQRERLRWATRPPEIYAVTKPTPVRLSSQAQDTFRPGTKEDEEIVNKVAASEIAAWYKP
jgi:hypothetical protein